MMRLLLAFLLLCGLALPALAAPLHCAALPDRTAAMAHGAHRAHHRKSESQPAGKVLASQDCIGCATLKPSPGATGETLPPSAGAPAMARLEPLAGRSAAPDTPPPRPAA